jgi:uncharacterized protein YndB with AHSA1/START domain
MTTPEYIKRWWSGNLGPVTTAEVDLRAGGTWRYVMLAGGEVEVAFHGEYREVVPNERIVCTEIYEGAPGAGAALCTYTFIDQGERSTVTLLTDFPSKEMRDIVLNSGMETGLQAGWDLLEEISVSLR